MVNGGVQPPQAGVQGRLVELRSLFTSRARGDWRVYGEFVAAKSNLPIGILTPEGKVVYLAVEPERLARCISSILRVEGPTARDGRWLKPEKVLVQTASGWKRVELE
jgi:hypothetical protein